MIDFMPGQSDEIDKGGTLRLGSYPCEIQSGSTMQRCYGTTHIDERHRHRYEFNNLYRDQLESFGLVLSGISPNGKLVEAVELSEEEMCIRDSFLLMLTCMIVSLTFPTRDLSLHRFVQRISFSTTGI